MDRLRVGLVGGGPWAKAVHGPGLAAHPGTEVAGVWTRRPEVAEQLVAKFGGRAHADVDDLIADVDAVAFAVPPQVQGRLAVRAAAAGRHLICEKLPREPAGADTVASACWLSGSLLGGPYSASVWRAEHGALLDLGPHVIDLLDAAVGAVVRVSWAHHDEPDLWRFGLDHAGGAHSTGTLSMRLPIDPSEIEFTVLGSAGRHRMAGRQADPQECYAALLDELVAAVDGSGPPPALDVARGLRLQELVDEVRTAAC